MYLYIGQHVQVEFEECATLYVCDVMSKMVDLMGI